MILRAAILLSLAALPGPLLAQADGSQAAPVATRAEEDVSAIFEGLALPGIIDVMAREGAQHGEALAEQVFAGASPPADWTEVVADIYAPERMGSEVLEALGEELAGEDTGAMRAFVESEPGRSFGQLELAARETLLDEEAEQAANEAAAVALAEDGPRLDLLRRYAEATDLIETNVVGAMNANYAYFTGLMDGGALDGAMTEGDVLADVWAQEAQIRADTTEWVYSFLLLAYEPASDADLEALIAFTETEPGQALNRALFDAFDGVFQEISRALGLASARYMTTEEI